MSETVISSNKVDWISKAKGFGVLGIVAVHAAQRFTILNTIQSLARAGMYCVQLFFIISVYLTFKSLEKQQESLTRKRYLAFLAHKILRFIPILYTAVVWHYLLYALYIRHLPNIKDSIYRNILFCITFLNGFSYHYINPWLNWYIGDLVIFIVLAPLLFKVINSTKKSIIFFIGSMIFAWVCTAFLSKCGIDITNDYFYFWFPSQLPVLALGIVCYYFEKEIVGCNLMGGGGIIQTFLFCLSFYVLFRMCFGINLMKDHVQYGFWLIILTYTLFNNSGKLFNCLKILGDNSYGIYLYHMCLLKIFNFFVRKFDINTHSLGIFICYYILLLLLSLLCAKTANVIFEKPFFKLMKNKFGV
jgi:Predicted acyltransferases